MSALNPNFSDVFWMWWNPSEYIKRDENKSAHTVWAKKVYKKYNYTCFRCGYKAYDGDMAIEAHHIYHKEFFPRMAYQVDNGICLCFECHRGKNDFSYHSLNSNSKGNMKVLKRWLISTTQPKKSNTDTNMGTKTYIIWSIFTIILGVLGTVLSTL